MQTLYARLRNCQFFLPINKRKQIYAIRSCINVSTKTKARHSLDHNLPRDGQIHFSIDDGDNESCTFRCNPFRTLVHVPIDAFIVFAGLYYKAHQQRAKICWSKVTCQEDDLLSERQVLVLFSPVVLRKRLQNAFLRRPIDVSEVRKRIGPALFISCPTRGRGDLRSSLLLTRLACFRRRQWQRFHPYQITLRTGCWRWVRRRWYLRCRRGFLVSPVDEGASQATSAYARSEPSTHRAKMMKAATTTSYGPVTTARLERERIVMPTM